MWTHYLLNSNGMLACIAWCLKIQIYVFNAWIFGLFPRKLTHHLLDDSEVTSVAECLWFLVQYEHFQGVSPGHLLAGRCCFQSRVWAWDPQGSVGEVNELTWPLPLTNCSWFATTHYCQMCSDITKRGMARYIFDNSWSHVFISLLHDQIKTLGSSLHFLVKVWSLLNL